MTSAGRAPGASPRRATKVVARRRALLVATVTVILLGVLLFAIFPTRTWWQQRQETAELEAELAEVRAELAKVTEEQKRLQTRAEIERLARENGYVNPGEEAFNILPAPAEPIGLPEGWPFTGVERAFGAS